MVAVTMIDESPARQVELANLAQGAGDLDATAAHLSAAIRQYTAAGDRKAAAMVCARLGDLFESFLGNRTAARAWFQRAARLLEDEPPCVEQGWVAVFGVGCEVDDPAVLRARAELALDRARRFGDVNLETKALADGGLAYVQAGQVAEGMTMLDEAMALACGPADDVEAAGKSVCSFLTACYYTADFDRAGSWAEALRRQGLIGEAPGVQVYLGSHCDSVQATALCELGRWGEAEALLTRSIEMFEKRMPIASWHPAIALAELRVRQGRLAEAEMLLVGKDGFFQVLLPAARLHLARGDYELARATARRGLRSIAGDRLRAAELLAVLVDIELSAGDVEAASQAYERLVSRAEGLDVPGLQARVAAVHARILAVAGDLAAAIGTMETAIDRLPPAGVPLLRARLLLDLIRLHDRAGNRAAAKVEAGHAAAVLADLDVALSPADRALLDRYCGPAASSDAAPPRTATLTREGKCWIVSCEGTRARLPETKGLRYVAELVAVPGSERHALDLVDRVEGVSGDGIDRRRLGDAGELVDAQARTAYRRRIEQLRGDIEDALDAGAHERAEALQEEIDSLVAQLAQAFGLGGRGRRASSAAERARLNVTRTLRAATAKIAEELPEAGRVLDRRLRTGLYCAYEPDPSDAVRWIVRL
jgi:tetratricopeptide (TPR) repeat protein